MVFMTIVPLIAFTIISSGGAWLLRDWQRFKQDTERIQNTIVHYEQEVAKREIENLLNFVNYEIAYSKSKGQISLEETKQKMIELIANIRYGEEGYVFILHLDGTIITSAQTTDPTGETVSAIMKAARENPEGSFVSYPWPKLNDPVFSPKTSYVALIPEFDWIVGAGYYQNDINEATIIRQQEMAQHFRKAIVQALIILALVSMAALILSRWFSSRISCALTMFSADLEKALHNGLPLNPGEPYLTEFRRISKTINRVLSTKRIAEGKVADSLKEKDILLKEIHHRTKNNLQIISSILSLQGSMIPDPQNKAVFDDCITRIHSMALIHQHLYNSELLSAIPVRKYCENLMDSLRSAYANPGTRIDIEIDINPESTLIIDKAIPFGLIINETVSNSLKHAFNNNNHGVIKISLQEDQDLKTLTISDDGNGILGHEGREQVDTPVNYLDMPHGVSLGMTLIGALTDQLGAECELFSGAGVTWVIRFPAD